MFTAEIRINGTLLTHIYGHNSGLTDAKRRHIYDVTCYSVETQKTATFQVNHERKLGINKLLSQILEELDTREI